MKFSTHPDLSGASSDVSLFATAAEINGVTRVKPVVDEHTIYETTKTPQVSVQLMWQDAMRLCTRYTYILDNIHKKMSSESPLKMGQFIYMCDISVYLFRLVYPFLSLFFTKFFGPLTFGEVLHHTPSFRPYWGRGSTCHDYTRFNYKTLLGENLLRASSRTFLILQQLLPIYSC